MVIKKNNNAHLRKNILSIELHFMNIKETWKYKFSKVLNQWLLNYKVYLVNLFILKKNLRG